ncbi:MAG TPA: hypothetical protein PK208_10260 [Fibrobacteria bacterium]|nr:hypothetical protein [Fibrobacteria bacterium]
MKSFSFISIAAMSALAAVPYKFEAKTPARAEEVNANFDYLEQGLKGKANQAGLDSVKSSLPTLAQWSNLATQPQLRDSAKAIRNSLDSYAKSGDLTVFAKDTALTAFQKKTQITLDSMNAAIAKKSEKTAVLSKDITGAYAIDTTGQIIFRSFSGPSNYLSIRAKEFGFYQPYSSLSTVFRANDQGNNISLIHNSRIAPDTIFTTSGSSITFPNTVYMTGTLNAPNIVATGIKSSSVADYVFDPSYQIMSLQEVESFANANRHLPEVPSATDIERNGMDIAKMNLILLKKIEELTLHAIAQQKEIDALKASVKNLQAQ